MFLTSTQREVSFEVVYNLNEVAEGLFLPSAYVVSTDKDGYLAHIRQRATKETINSFGLELNEVRSHIFQIIETLQPKELEKKFSPPKRKVKPLEELLAEPEIEKAIYTLVHRKLDEALTLIVKHGLPLTMNVDRRVLVKDFLMELPKKDLEAQLFFKRTKDSVLYRLLLSDGEKTWKVSSVNEILPITNHPAWLFADYRLYKVAHINGNMVKPFRQRDEVTIPAASVKTYFQKFILKVAAKVEIEAEGFDMVYLDELVSCRLELTRNLFTGVVTLAAQMLYPKADFNWSDRRDKRTMLEFDEADIRIIQIRRNQEAENAYLEKLKSFGLEQLDGAFFTPVGASENQDPYQLVDWVIAHRQKLEKAGFEVAPALLEEQTVYLEKAELQLHSERINDWFDIYGKVVIGEFTIPFLALAKYIREDNRFYPLPNGQYFLIPLEWMSKYKTLVQFARKEGQQLRLNKNQFTLLQQVGIAEDASGEEDWEDIDFKPSVNLRAELRPYQLEGIKWLVQLYRNELGACLADDMGLGKTLQTIGALLYAKEIKALQPAETAATTGATVQLNLFDTAPDEDFLQPLNALIILPASLVFNWESEIQKFAPFLTVYRHVGARRHRDIRILRRFDVILTTYQTALRDVDLLEELEYEYIVLDESQQIKNRESKIFKAINELNGRHKVSLSGTPIENSLSDLWSQMQFINPDLLGNFSFFKKEFITPIEKYQNDEKKIQLRNLVKPYMLRRTKEEVAKDLPPLTTQTFFSEMTPEQKKLYEKEKSEVRNYLLDNFDANNPQYRILLLKSLTKLRQMVNHPVLVSKGYQKESGKFNDILELWDTIRRSNHKALFFSSFVQYLELFREAFEQRDQPYAWLTGDLTQQERFNQIEKFEKNPEVQSFLISIKSGGTGLNLTSADYVFILDPWWNPTTEQQAIARAHRIGQEKNVIAIKFITKDSIEEKILMLQERKSKLAEDIIENVRKSDFSIGDIEYLLE